MSALLDSYFGDMSFVERKAPVSRIDASNYLDYAVTESIVDTLDSEPSDLNRLIEENIDMEAFWATQKAALVAFYYSTHAYRPTDREMFRNNFEVFSKSLFQQMVDTLEKVATND
jgi:kynurenine formamidase